MIQRVTLLLLFVSLTISAQELSLDFFKDKPKSLAKDFYISQFLDQDISKEEAQALLPQVKNLNAKLFKKFSKYIDKFKRKAYCQQLKATQLEGRDADCIAYALSLYKATKLPAENLEKIALALQRQRPTLATQYFAISTKKFSNLEKLPAKLLIKTFTQVGTAFRKKYYDFPLSQTTLHKLEKEKTFSIMIEKIVRGTFPNLQKSILDINASQLDAESNFLLALNALRFQKKKLAIDYLKRAAQKAPFSFEKDKAIFWQYLLTRDQTLLSTLIESHEINIYSLYAYEELGKFPQNITYAITPKTSKQLIDISDPFAWIKLKEKVKAMPFKNYEAKRAWVMQYNTAAMEPYISRLLYRFKNNQHFYLTPYAQYLSNLPIERKILIYALARQESHFIPTEVSYSYALGMMQFMPYVAKDIAKKANIKHFSYEDMFKPQIAYKFANIHLDFLEKSLHHPLFIAYAYNAGIGFTKRNILSKGYFKKGFYEPFWSMEMIPNAQARKYGKRVLSNYAIYAKRLGLHLTLKNLLQTLK